MNRTKRLVLILTILILTVASDQATKKIAAKHLKSKAPVSYAGDTFRLQYALNKGAFLSFGSRFPDKVRFWIMTVLPTFFLLGLLVYTCFTRDLEHTHILAFVFIIGGGIGNLMDRMLNDGYVIDFMNIGLGPVRTGIFNVADMAVMLGFVIMCVSQVIDYFLKR